MNASITQLLRNRQKAPAPAPAPPNPPPVSTPVAAPVITGSFFKTVTTPVRQAPIAPIVVTRAGPQPPCVTTVEITDTPEVVTTPVAPKVANAVPTTVPAARINERNITSVALTPELRRLRKGETPPPPPPPPVSITKGRHSHRGSHYDDLESERKEAEKLEKAIAEGRRSEFVDMSASESDDGGKLGPTAADRAVSDDDDSASSFIAPEGEVDTTSSDEGHIKARIRTHADLIAGLVGAGMRHIDAERALVVLRGMDVLNISAVERKQQSTKRAHKQSKSSDRVHKGDGHRVPHHRHQRKHHHHKHTASVNSGDFMTQANITAMVEMHLVHLWCIKTETNLAELVKSNPELRALNRTLNAIADQRDRELDGIKAKLTALATEKHTASPTEAVQEDSSSHLFERTHDGSSPTILDNARCSVLQKLLDVATTGYTIRYGAITVSGATTNPSLITSIPKTDDPKIGTMLDIQDTRCVEVCDDSNARPQSYILPRWLAWFMVTAFRVFRADVMVALLVCDSMLPKTGCTTDNILEVCREISNTIGDQIGDVASKWSIEHGALAGAIDKITS